MIVNHDGKKRKIPEAKFPGHCKNEASRLASLKKNHN